MNQANAPRSFFKRLFGGLLSLGISLGIALLAGEGISRWLLKEKMILFPMNQEAVTYGDFTIRRLRANTEFVNTSMDGSWRFRINRNGLRESQDYAYAKPADTVRVLAIGDSHTQGIEVRQEQTYSKVLERYLNANTPDGKRYEVINAGISSFGTQEELVYLENEGVRYEPDIVVLGFFANDPVDDTAAALFRLENGELVVNRKEYVPGSKLAYQLNSYSLFRWLSQHSYFYSFTIKSLQSIVRQRKPENDPGVNLAISEKPATDEQSGMTAKLIERMHRFCKDNGAKLIILDIADITTPQLKNEELYSRDFRSSVPEELSEVMRKNSDYFIGAEALLGDLRNVASLHAPHGQRHISETTHLFYGIQLGNIILDWENATAVAKK